MPDGNADNEQQEIIDAAVAAFGGEAPDEDENTEAPAEGQEPEEDTDAEDAEDPDNVEDDDQDNPEDDEEEESEEDDEDAGDDAPVEVADDATVKLADGTEITGRELREGYLRQADYTHKTQQLATERKQVQDTYQTMQNWYEQRANNPQAWVAEIAAGSEDPAATIAGAIEQSGTDPNLVLGQVLRVLVENETLDEGLIEALNLGEVAKQAKGQSALLKVQRLEQQIQHQSHTAAQQQAMAAAEAEINRQWETLKAAQDLTFENPQTEFSEKVRLLEFARDNQIVNLGIAWAAMTALAGTQKAVTPAPPKAAKAKAKAVVSDKKRKTAGMSRQPTGAGGPTKQTVDTGLDDLLSTAASAALNELGRDDL